MDLIEDLLPLGWVSRRLLCGVQLVQRRVAVEGSIGSIGWDLTAGKHRVVIGVVGQRILELAKVIPARDGSGRRGGIAAMQERSEVRTGGGGLGGQIGAQGFLGWLW